MVYEKELQPGKYGREASAEISITSTSSAEDSFRPISSAQAL
jgi:hypothetical protein